jgi:hypothetical protein
MKRILPILIISIFIDLHSVAQNLVLNPGLESYITCPGFGQFSNSYIDDWDKPTYGSTDYYNYNCAGIIPSQQIPRTGNAYAGIIAYNYGQEYREYMTGMLTAPLNPGATYYCEFFVSLNDGYIQAVKEIGAHFSVSSPGPYANSLHVPLTPQIQNTITLLDDTSNWMRISGYFLASGGEQYITIGNFNDDAGTTIVQVGSSGSYGSYYFVDDVWLSLAEGTGIGFAGLPALAIYPNPAEDKLYIQGSLEVYSIATISDLAGRKITEVMPDMISNDLHCVNLDVNAGIYLIEIPFRNGVFRKKIIMK